MTPAESAEVNKILADPLDQMKAEAYKYIDITRPEEVRYQEQCHPKLEEKDLDFKNKDTEISIRSEETREAEKAIPVEGKILKDHLFEESTFAPYVDDIAEEQRSAPLMAAPVKITLTEIEPSIETATPEKTPEKQDICLKPSPDTVPTVTVSEPEDDSPGSITPPSSGTAIDLLYWRDIKQTGIVFGSFLLLLFSLTQFSVVSVVAYLALAALSATISFRIYKSVLQAVQKTDEGHPFKAYLELEITLSQEQIQKYTDCLQFYVNNTLKELRRLFLVQDLVDSLKFAVLMWLLTYVGALFNGLTLLLMAVVSMFTLPVVYVKHQAQIDQYLGLVRTHINAVVAKIQAKIPGAKRHTE
ncbi:reticulon-1 isoform X1 [Bubalus kerabau]|uniref:reticulon-1 isoform X1 n=1 Tax=Bubalus carabanensis TaxID=3119969 RepID=UPI00244EE2BE|nr:reticulon-1 isoform X1 [Bubalus carabanensis]